MADIKAVLLKKVGPLPLGVWLAVGAGGVAYMAYRRRAGGDAGYDFRGNEADTMYGVPIESGEDEYDFPMTPPPPTGGVGGGGSVYLPPPLYSEPDPDVGVIPELPGIPSPPVVRQCTQRTLPAIHGGYPSAPNRECPQGWHRANSGPCAGLCIQNVGA